MRDKSEIGTTVVYPDELSVQIRNHFINYYITGIDDDKFVKAYKTAWIQLGRSDLDFWYELQKWSGIQHKVESYEDLMEFLDNRASCRLMQSLIDRTYVEYSVLIGNSVTINDLIEKEREYYMDREVIYNSAGDPANKQVDMDKLKKAITEGEVNMGTQVRDFEHVEIIKEIREIPEKIQYNIQECISDTVKCLISQYHERVEKPMTDLLNPNLEQLTKPGAPAFELFKQVGLNHQRQCENLGGVIKNDKLYYKINFIGYDENVKTPLTMRDAIITDLAFYFNQTFGDIENSLEETAGIFEDETDRKVIRKYLKRKGLISYKFKRSQHTLADMVEVYGSGVGCIARSNNTYIVIRDSKVYTADPAWYIEYIELGASEFINKDLTRFYVDELFIDFVSFTAESLKNI